MEAFTISIPRERPFATIVGLVVGGIAARHEVTLDVLDDLQLALDGLLERSEEDGGDVTIEVHVADGTITTFVGPLTAAAAGELEREAGSSLGLRRLLETVVDSVSLAERDGGSWVELRKGYALAEAEAG